MTGEDLAGLVATIATTLLIVAYLIYRRNKYGDCS